MVRRNISESVPERSSSTGGHKRCSSQRGRNRPNELSPGANKSSSDVVVVVCRDEALHPFLDAGAGGSEQGKYASYAVRASQ